MNRPKRPPTIQIILRIIYVIALIYYLCNGNVFLIMSLLSPESVCFFLQYPTLF